MAQHINRQKQNKMFAMVPALIVSVPVSVLYYLYTGAPYISVLLGSFLAMTAAFYAMMNCRRKEALMLFGVLVIKFILTAYQAKNKDLPLGGEDWGNYHAAAKELLNSCGSNYLKILIDDGADMFSKLCAIIYGIFGVHTMQIYLYVLASSFVAVNYVFKTVDIMTDGDYTASVITTLAFSVWPIDIIYSVTYLREMPIQTLVIMSFYLFIRFFKRRHFVDFVLSFLCIAMASMMHSGVIAFAFVYIVFAVLHEGQSLSSVLKPQYLVIFAVAIGGLMVTPLWSSMIAKLGDVSTVDGMVERAGQFLEGEANTRYISEVPQNSIQLFVQAPYRAILFAFVPLPWMIYSFDTALSWMLDALPQVYIVYKIFELNKMTKRSRKYRLYYIMFVLAFSVTYVICGMGTTAYGNAIRHRAKILPVVLCYIIGLSMHIKTMGRERLYERHGYNSGLQRRKNDSERRFISNGNIAEKR